MSTTISPNMNLVIPTVGTEAGPDYAIDINACLTIIDQHDHSNGSGAKITPAGLNINANLPMAGNALTATGGVTFTSPLTSLANSTIYQSSTDLYFIDGLGNNVRLTQNGGVAGSPGQIANLNSPASATYVAANQTFVWQSGTNIAANLDAASILLRNLTANSPALTLTPPTLGSNYTLTLPSLPASTLPMQLSSAGVMSTGQITTAQIADAAVTAAKRAPMTSGSTAAGIGQYAVGPMIAGYNNTAGTFTTFPGCTLSITTTGRPVMVLVQPYHLSAGNAELVIAGPSGNAVSLNAALKILESTNNYSSWPMTIGESYVITSGSVSNTSVSPTWNQAAGDYTHATPATTSTTTTTVSSRSVIIPPVMSFILTPPAGTYTFSLQGAYQGTGGGALSAQNLQIIAYEIG